MATLLSDLAAGKQVLVAVDLHYIPEFGSYDQGAGHVLVFHGHEYVNNQWYVDVTNGWSIQTGTTQTTGTDPKNAYPITQILESDFFNGWKNDCTRSLPYQRDALLRRTAEAYVDIGQSGAKQAPCLSARKDKCKCHCEE